MNKYIIAFDVGGIFIKSAVLNEQGEMIPDSYAIFPSKSNESKEAIIEHIYISMKQQSNRILDKNINILGVGFAFPGPFDYEKGISYIKGVDKFDQLYGVNLHQELMTRVELDQSFLTKTNTDFRILFDNDANLFALGEQMSGIGQHFNKAIYLTIGAGTGSAFMEDGQLIKSREDVPNDGWIYEEPFGKSIVNDYISRKGILRLTEEMDILMKDDQVKTLAEMAKENNVKAKKVFYNFGKNIGKVLNPHIKSFAPEAIVLGGQIAKSKQFFIGGMYETLDNKIIIIEDSDDTSVSTFSGVANLINQSIRK